MPESMTNHQRRRNAMSHKEYKPPQRPAETLDLTGTDEPGGHAASSGDVGNNYLITLKGVRKPGKGELQLGEAVKTAIEQGIAYEEWQEFGAPPGIFEVWVEADNVLTLQPGETTSLKSVLCELPSLENVVVQVVRRADEVADTVVLLNRKLDFVPAEGIKFVEEHPNEQGVMLKMKRGEEGQLKMWLGFGQIDSLTDLEPEPEEVNPPKPRRLGAFAMALLNLFTTPPAWGFALAAVVLCFGVQIVRPARQRNLAEQINPAIAATTASAAQAQSDFADPALAGSSSSCDSLTIDSSLESAGHEVLAASVANVERLADIKAAAADRRAKPAERGAQHHPPAARGAQNKPSHREASESQIAAAPLLPPLVEEKASHTSAWELHRLRRLAEVRLVILQLENGSRMEAADAQALLESIGGALKTAGINVVTNEAEKPDADGTMSVRFEPDATCFGAIFALMRDRDENTLWQGHADCHALPHGGGHVAMFQDASARLVGKLPVFSTFTPQTGVEREEAVVLVR